MDNMELINNPDFIYYHNSPVGRFYIRFSLSMGKWELGMKDEVFGYYLSTMVAADDVFSQSTGCDEWDMIDVEKITEIAPTDIYEWERLPIKRA